MGGDSRGRWGHPGDISLHQMLARLGVVMPAQPKMVVVLRLATRVRGPPVGAHLMPNSVLEGPLEWRS